MIKNTAQILLVASLCLASIQGAAQAPNVGAAQAPGVRYDDPNPFASADICQMKADDFLTKAAHPLNLMANYNADGPLGTGMCWWHSKMQRAAIYLAIFDRPDLPKPTTAEALNIFAKLRDLKEVVSIPGFANWFDFSNAYKTEFYQILGHWEVRDTLQLQFLKGIRSTEANPEMLKKISQEVNDYKRLTFLLLKMPLLEAHSWLAQSFELNGADFEVGFIDSNSPHNVNNYKSKGNVFLYQEHSGVEENIDPVTGQITRRYLWEAKENKKSYPRSEGMVYPSVRRPKSVALYLQNDNLDFQNITAAVKAYCGAETPFTLHEKEVAKLKLQREFERQNWYRAGNPHN